MQCTNYTRHIILQLRYIIKWEKHVGIFYFQFTPFLAEENVVKTPIVEIACVSVNLVVMETHTQIV